MITSSTDASGTAAALTAATSATTASNTLDQQAFLTLMVAQLRNQDPMNPTDSSEFLSQTAQFTSLEKLTAVADQTAQALQAQLTFGASSLVGRTVTYTGQDGAEKTGTVSAVRFSDSGPRLSVGDADVALTDLVTVTS